MTSYTIDPTPFEKDVSFLIFNNNGDGQDTSIRVIPVDSERTITGFGRGHGRNLHASITEGCRNTPLDSSVGGVFKLNSSHRPGTIRKIRPPDGGGKCYTPVSRT